MNKLIFCLTLLLTSTLSQADFETGASYGNEGKFELANQEFQKGIEQGEAMSYFGLGGSYYFGDGVEVDMERAYKLFTKGAELKNGESAFMLSVMYAEGKHVKKDDKKYLEYLTQAALSCVTQAQHELGYLYMDGHYMEKDYTEAAALFLAAYWIDGNQDIPLNYLIENISPEQREKALTRQKDIIAAGQCETQRG